MVALKSYDVEVNGKKTTLLLDTKEAELRGLGKPAAAVKAADKPANKGRAAANKGD